MDRKNRKHILWRILTLKETWQFKVKGSSMRPLLHEGDILVCRRADFSEVRIGDVVICDVSGRLIAHRLIKKEALGILITKGDNCPNIDFPVVEEQLIGVVTRVVRGNISFDYSRQYWKWFNYLMGIIISLLSKETLVCLLFVY